MTVVTKAEDAGGWSAYDTDTCMTGDGATQREAIINLTDKLATAGLYMLQQINPPAALTKARLEASVIIAALQHAADRGVVSFNVAENAVEFMWPPSDAGRSDALLVFEAFTGRLDKGKGQ